MLKERKRSVQLSIQTPHYNVLHKTTHKFYYKSVKFHPGVRTQNQSRSPSSFKNQKNLEKRLKKEGEAFHNRFV